MSYNNNPWGSTQRRPAGLQPTIFLTVHQNWHGETYLRNDSAFMTIRDLLSTVLEKPQVKANLNLAKPLTSHKPTGIEASYANHQDNEDQPNEDYLALFKMCLPFLVPQDTYESC